VELHCRRATLDAAIPSKAAMIRTASQEFRGEQLRHIDAGGVVLCASRFAPGVVIEQHVHTEAYVCVLVGGPLDERSDTGHAREAGLAVILHPGGERHANHFHGPGLCVNLSIGREWLGASLQIREPWTIRRSVHAGPWCDLGLRLLRLYARRSMDVSPLDLEGVAAELAGANLSHLVPRPSASLRLVVEHMRAQPASPWRLADYARLVDVHPVYFARVFRRAFGTSLGQYQRHLRLRRASALIARDDMSLTDIAAASGFCDQSHLTQALTRSAGLAPAALRHRLQPARQ
jgi:AraC family transcriptional regulator